MTSSHTPWQLTMFQYSLKKQLKLAALQHSLGETANLSCLLVTCGDNNGALNWHFRSSGGRWEWGDVSEENLSSMSQFLGEPVHHLNELAFPFETGQFDRIVAIDVLEHLENDQPFLCELKRVLKTDGLAIVTVPNGDPKLLANKIKWRIGMTPEIYGHTRAGYTIPELQASVSSVGLKPIAKNGYSRFFTEMVELIINFGYVFVLSRKKQTPQGQIAPSTERELKTHGLAYHVYSALFPLFKLISKLDNLLPSSTDNAVIVTATKVE